MLPADWTTGLACSSRSFSARVAECGEEPDSKGAAIPADDGPLGDRLCLSGRWSRKALPDFEPRPHFVDNESYFMRAPLPGKGGASSRRKRQFFIRRFDGSCSLYSFPPRKQTIATSGTST